MLELPGFTERVVLFVMAFLVTVISSRLMGIYLERYLSGKVRQRAYRPAVKLIQYGIYALGFYIMIIHIMQFDVPASLAALGILGIAIFLPVVPILQSYASGLFLSIERPFSEEDYILYNDEICRVKDMGMRRTLLRSENGKLIYVPNILFITATPVVNYTRGRFIRVQRPLLIKNYKDISKIKELVNVICSDSTHILPNIPQSNLNQLKKWLRIENKADTKRKIQNLHPRVHIKKIEKDKIELETRFWIWDIAQRDDAITSFYQQLLEKCEENKIELG